MEKKLKKPINEYISLINNINLILFLILIKFIKIYLLKNLVIKNIKITLYIFNNFKRFKKLILNKKKSIY